MRIQSPYRKVLELEGKCLFLGVGMKSNTMFHVAEEMTAAAYMRYKTIRNQELLVCSLPQSSSV
jgi:aminoglycoside N3'-acetyltransferase